MIELIYGLLLGITHFFNDWCEHALHKYKDNIISLAAGVSIAYFFLVLFPELTTFTNHSSILFTISLLGFAIFHIAEKHVYQHRSKKKILHEMKEIHGTAFFFYHFMLGMTIVYISKISFTKGILFFIPIWFHSFVSSISLSEIHHHLKSKLHMKIILSSASILGISLGLVYTLPEFIQGSILAFIIGALLYIIVRDLIPKERTGHVTYFILGIILMILFILFSTLI
jgi:zinc transporter ZupT